MIQVMEMETDIPAINVYVCVCACLPLYKRTYELSEYALVNTLYVMFCPLGHIDAQSKTQYAILTMFGNTNRSNNSIYLSKIHFCVFCTSPTAYGHTLQSFCV